MAVKTKTPELGEMLVWESNPRFTRTAGILRNTSGAAIPAGTTLPLFYPLKLASGKYVLTIAGDEANVTHLLIQPYTLPAQVANNVDIVADMAIVGDRYDFMYVGAFLPATDVAGAALNSATLITALAAKGAKSVSLAPSNRTSTGVA
jgi:hypothetical protein